MYTDGLLLTAGERCRLHSGVFGVTRYDPDRSFDGYTLFSPAYGYREYLVDMRGLLLHSWPVTHSDVAELLPNGNLLTHNDGRWLEEIRPDGSVKWRWEGDSSFDLGTHHDFCYVDDQFVHLSRIVEPVIEGVYDSRVKPDCMKTDVLLRVNRQGEVLWEFSFSDHIDRICELSGLPLPIPYARRTKGGIERYGPADWAHTNTVEVLPPNSIGEKDPRFRAGNVMVSFRALDVIAIVDPEENAVVWCYGLGTLDGQHQPTMLENGNILLFDNGTYRGHSIVRELNPQTGRIVWEYSDEEGFFSPFRSGVQRLPNGNTLICECDAGRLFEVTPGKEIVWEYFSPFVGQGYEHLGKRMHRATRYPPSYAEPLLKSRKDRVIGEVDHEGRRLESYLDLVGLYESTQGAARSAG
jgi:hypothetical protein